MKQFTLVVLLVQLMLGQCKGQYTWIVQDAGTTVNLKSVEFSDEYNGWIVGDSGAIFHTTNGGTNWVRQNSGTIHNLHAVSSVNATLCNAVGDSSTFLRTTDGGVTWLQQSLSHKYTMRSVFFANADEGWACGGGYGEGDSAIWQGIILHTSDGGASWNNQISTTVGFFIIQFINNFDGYALGFSTADPVLYYTRNSGTTWQTRGISILVTPPYSMFFVNLDRGFLTWRHSQGVGALVSTTNRGNSWASPPTFFTSGDARSVTFANTNLGFICGSSGMLYCTTNGGTSWAALNSGTFEALNDVFFANDSVGWLVGDYGIVLHTTHRITSVADQEHASAKPFSLDQNYPNPFNPATTITYTLPRDAHVNLSIFNILGERIATLIDEEQEAGSKSVDWIANSVPSGVYFYCLRAGQSVSMKRMVLLR